MVAIVHGSVYGNGNRKDRGEWKKVSCRKSHKRNIEIPASFLNWESGGNLDESESR